MLSLSSDMHCHYVKLCLKMWDGHPESLFQAVYREVFLAAGSP